MVHCDKFDTYQEINKKINMQTNQELNGEICTIEKHSFRDVIKAPNKHVFVSLKSHCESTGLLPHDMSIDV